MKKRRYPKAWDLNNVIISFDKSNTALFLTKIFPLICLRNCGTTKILSYERLALQEGPCILLWELQAQLQQDFMSVPASNPPLRITCKTWIPISAAVCFCISCPEETQVLHSTLSADTSQQSRAQPSVLSNGTGFWLQWEKCWRASLVESSHFCKAAHALVNLSVSFLKRCSNIEFLFQSRWRQKQACLWHKPLLH